MRAQTEAHVESIFESKGGVESMVESEFVNGLVRVAHLRFGGANGSSPSFVSLQERLEHLLSVHLIPTARLGMPTDDFLAMVKSRRTRAILNKHGKLLRHIFSNYAAADISSAEARDAADSVNLKELLFMMKEGNLIDRECTQAKIALIFTVVNLENTLKSAEQLTSEGIPTDENEADDVEDELCFAEWCDVIVRMINLKIPAEAREAEGKDFWTVLDEYLGNVLIPHFVQLVKDKKRGVGSKYVD